MATNPWSPALAARRDGPDRSPKARRPKPAYLRAGYVLLAVAALVATAIACSRLDLSSLRSARPGWVAAAFALNAASMVLRALAWLGILRGAFRRERIPVGRVVRATMIGVLGSAAAPGRVGEPLRTWLVARRVDQPQAVATVVGTLLSQTVLNLVALALLSLVALPGTLLGHGSAPMLAVVAWPCTLAVAALIAARLVRHGRLARHLGALRSGLAVFRQPRRGIAISAAQLAAWGLQTLAAYALLRALDINVAAPLATAAAVLVAVNVTAAVPLTPSNVGIFQAACIGVLASVGVPSGQGLAYGLLLQGIELLTALALGLPAAAAELAIDRGSVFANRGTVGSADA
jgi:uncharacterized membrane protein YbhN (UPF0104 family)